MQTVELFNLFKGISQDIDEAITCVQLMFNCDGKSNEMLADRVRNIKQELNKQYGKVYKDTDSVIKPRLNASTHAKRTRMRDAVDSDEYIRYELWFNNKLQGYALIRKDSNPQIYLDDCDWREVN